MSRQNPMRAKGRFRGARDATVYDAVAGRIDYEGFISPAHTGEIDRSITTPPESTDIETNSTHAQKSRRGHPVPPEEVLFRSRGAPERFEEDDSYSYDRYLQYPQELPESDLLKAIHAYVSDFYSRGTDDGGANDMLSMDESALMACGVLLEEASRQLLGEQGEWVLTEPDVERLFEEEYRTPNFAATRAGSRNEEERRKRRKRDEDGRNALALGEVEKERSPSSSSSSSS